MEDLPENIQNTIEEENNSGKRGIYESCLNGISNISNNSIKSTKKPL